MEHKALYTSINISDINGIRLTTEDTNNSSISNLYINNFSFH